MSVHKIQELKLRTLMMMMEVVWHLSNNNLKGPFPSLAALQSLNYLDMSNNTFDPSDVPTWLLNLQNLTTLLLDNTQLQGEIPSSLFSFPHLESVVLSNNNLSGTLIIGSVYNSYMTLTLNNNSIEEFQDGAQYNLNIIALLMQKLDRSGTVTSFARAPAVNGSAPVQQSISVPINGAALPMLPLVAEPIGVFIACIYEEA